MGGIAFLLISLCVKAFRGKPQLKGHYLAYLMNLLFVILIIMDNIFYE